MSINSYKQFTEVSYSGTNLLKNHSLDEEGVWEIYGEDPNCDMGGHHHEPHLDTVIGKLRDVIEYAVDLPNFWQWGAGGRITKQKNRRAILNVTEAKKRLSRVAELKNIIATAKHELEALDEKVG